jgi:hypothetical protein
VSIYRIEIQCNTLTKHEHHGKIISSEILTTWRQQWLT